MAMPEQDTPTISVIVVNFNTAHLLDEMAASLRRAAGNLRLQVIVVDNASSDGSVDVIRSRFPDFELIANDRNVGFGRANNQALDRLRGEFILLLNTDAFVLGEGSLQRAVDAMRRDPSIGVLGARLIGRDEVLQPSCRYFPTVANEFVRESGLRHRFPNVRMVDDMTWDHASLRECDWVPGCFYLMPRRVIETVGLFDPRFFLYFEEVDHCRRVKQAGWKVVYCPDVTVIHIGGESAKSVSAITRSGRQISGLQVESSLLYFRKHHGLGGVLLLALSSWLLAGVRMFRRTLQRRPLADLAASWSEAIAQARALRRTRFGAAPTR